MELFQPSEPHGGESSLIGNCQRLESGRGSIKDTSRPSLDPEPLRTYVTFAAGFAPPFHRGIYAHVRFLSPLSSFLKVSEPLLMFLAVFPCLGFKLVIKMSQTPKAIPLETI